MKSLIICVSIHHQNTEKIAEIIAENLPAEIKKPDTVRSEDLASYNIIGFGSGIYRWKHHKDLLNFVDNMTEMEKKPVFIFSTSRFANGIKFHKKLRNKLLERNCNIIGEFNCPGYYSAGPIKIIGGVNKNRPNENDYEKARIFTQTLIEKLNINN